jgi:hypothetical protein
LVPLDTQILYWVYMDESKLMEYRWGQALAKKARLTKIVEKLEGG